MNSKLILILIVAFCALLGAIGQVFFKLASGEITSSIFSWLNWKLIIGLFLYGVATIIFILALRHGNLSILYPIIATSYLWVSAFAVLFLGETFPLFKWVGVLLIIIGVGIVTL
jgi:drug/metabolite transporter (DMT)-like permease